MKVALASDIHLEFGTVELKNDQNADALILSGDICVASQLKFEPNQYGAKKSNSIHDFFENCCKEFPEVIYVVGNHEHYHGDYAETIPHLRKMLGYLPNLHILDKETFTLGDVTFIGGTLWTDMNKEDSLTLFHIKSKMNDFNVVDNGNNMVSYKAFVPMKKPELMSDVDWLNDHRSGRTVPEFKTRKSKFSPQDAVEDHKKMVKFIELVTEGKHDQKFIVVGHHTPSNMSCHPLYKDDFLMNGGYHSDLSELILDHPQIKLWTHGHTHVPFDYTIGSTRVVCNPRGYINFEKCADTWKLKYLEI